MANKRRIYSSPGRLYSVSSTQEGVPNRTTAIFTNGPTIIGLTTRTGESATTDSATDCRLHIFRLEGKVGERVGDSERKTTIAQLNIIATKLLPLAIDNNIA